MRLAKLAALLAAVMLSSAHAATSYSGHVYDTHGQALAGVTVLAGDVFPVVFGFEFRVAGETTTAADGSYVIADLPAGPFESHILAASGTGVGTLIYPDHPCYTGRSCLDSLTSNAYAIAAPVAAADFALPHSGSISGNVAAGVPIVWGGEPLRVYRAGSPHMQLFPLPSSHYTLDGLWPGSYVVCVNRAVEQDLLGQCNGGLDFDSLSEGDVAAGAEPIEIAESASAIADFALHPASHIKGNVVSAIDGALMASAIDARHVDGSNPDPQRLDEVVGPYSLSVAPGSFEIVFSLDDYFVPLTLPVNVGAEQDVVLDAPVVPRATMAGTLVDAQTHAPLVGVRVVADGDTFWPATATSGADGHFLVQGVGAGLDYFLHTEGATGLINLSYPDIPFGPGPQPSAIVLASDENRTGLDFSLSAGGSISGRIHDLDTDAPVADAKVHIFSGFQSEWGNATWSDAQGRYRTSAVPPGNYYVVVELPQSNWVWPAVACDDWPWACTFPPQDAIAVDAAVDYPGFDFALPGIDLIMRNGFD